ncbi:MAG: MarP family serine protease [Actinobacteria bacterium]|nr:MarP family serine protease [Actinomycetota bacterium]
MNLLDLVLVVLAVVAAVGGYRLGFLARGASWLGLVAGILVGVWAVPNVLRVFTAGDPLTRMLVGVGTLLLAVSVLTAIGESIGLRLRRRVHGTALRPFDQSIGAVAGLLAIGLLVWFLAPGAAEVPGAVSRQVRTSAVVRTVADLTPEPPNTVQTLRNLIGRSRFPQVFADLQPAPDTGPPPSEIPVPPDVVARVTASTVNVEVDACGGRFEGSGWTVAPDRVVTNAHVVAGADVVTVRRPDGQVREGRVIAFDGGVDLALLAIPDLGQQPLPMAPGEVGSDGATVGYPGGQDEPRTEPVSIRDRRNTIGRDIYGREPVERELLFLAASLRQGDSGSAVFDVQGRVVGTVFAVSPDRASTAYALDHAEVRRFLDGPRSEGAGPCA